MFNPHIHRIKAVLGSITTDQQSEINYNYNNTNIGINRQDQQTPIKEEPLEQEDKAVDYGRTQNTKPVGREGKEA